MNIKELAEKAERLKLAKIERMVEEADKVGKLLQGQGLPLLTRLRCELAAKEYLQNEIKNLEIFQEILFDLTADEEASHERNS